MVDAESFSVLLKAVVKTIKQEVGDTVQRRGLFDALTSVVNLCHNQMRKLKAFLLKEKVEETKVQEKLREVEDMCLHFKRLKERYDIPEYLESEYKRRWTRVPVPKFWTAEQKEAGLRVYEDQVRSEKKHLDRFSTGDKDKRILAEAAYLADTYHAGYGRDVSIFLASSDTRFFSPFRESGGVTHRFISDEIQTRFGIVCDWPSLVAKDVAPLLK